MAKIRSSKITRSAKGEDCALRISQNCLDGDTVVFCHINTNYKGWGLKSPDLFGVYGCYECHQLLDSSKIDDSEILRAFIETLMKLNNKGLIELA